MQPPLNEDSALGLLRNSEIFSAVPDDDLEILARGFERKTFRAGEIAVAEGDRSAEIFLVADGEFEVFEDEGGSRRVLGTMSRGDLFGEMAALTGGNRYASVAASTDSAAYVNAEASFRQALRASKALSDAICRSLGRYA